MCNMHSLGRGIGGQRGLNQLLLGSCMLTAWFTIAMIVTMRHTHCYNEAGPSLSTCFV